MTYQNSTDEQWLEAIKRSTEHPDTGLPGFPPAETQQIVNGSDGEAALDFAYKFWRFVKERSPLNRDTQVLDFGVGWGRIFRFFLRDIDAGNLHGVDVDTAMIEILRETQMPGNFSLVKSMQRLGLADGSIDLAYAFSVFSHISEQSAVFHLKDIVRTLKPGGKLFLTTTAMRFLDLCLACQMKDPALRNNWEDILGGTFTDASHAKATYLAGEYTFAPVGGHADLLPNDQYGWAAMPASFVQRICPEVGIEVIDDLSISEQAVFVLTKA
jgi:SAM-dependent methyltransferase